MSLPKDFQPEQAGESKYIMNKLNSGEKIKFRILTDFIVGKMVWGDGEDGTRFPTRRRLGENFHPGDIGFNQKTKKPELIRQFIAAVVWNYKTEQLEIFETTKATIIGPIYEIESNEDWGDSKGYDLTVSKTGEGMETRYSVLPSNKSVFKCPKDPKTVNLQALYSGEDPFADTASESKIVADEAFEALVDEDNDSDKIPF